MAHRHFLPGWGRKMSMTSFSSRKSIIPNFKDFWVGDDHGSDHFIINGVFSYTPIYNKMNEKTVRLFHKADWIDINFSIRTTMTKATLNKRNVTEDEIDNYVDTLTNTIHKCPSLKRFPQNPSNGTLWVYS